MTKNTKKARKAPTPKKAPKKAHRVVAKNPDIIVEFADPTVSGAYGAAYRPLGGEVRLVRYKGDVEDPAFDAAPLVDRDDDVPEFEDEFYVYKTGADATEMFEKIEAAMRVPKYGLEFARLVERKMNAPIAGWA